MPPRNEHALTFVLALCKLQWAVEDARESAGWFRPPCRLRARAARWKTECFGIIQNPCTWNVGRGPHTRPTNTTTTGRQESLAPW